MWAFKFLSEEHLFFYFYFFNVIIWSHRSKRKKKHSKDFSKNLRSIISTISLLYPHDRKKKDEV